MPVNTAIWIFQLFCGLFHTMSSKRVNHTSNHNLDAIGGTKITHQHLLRHIYYGCGCMWQSSGLNKAMVISGTSNSMRTCGDCSNVSKLQCDHERGTILGPHTLAGASRRSTFNSHPAKAPYMAASIIGRSASFLEETVNRYLTRGLLSTFYIRK